MNEEKLREYVDDWYADEVINAEKESVYTDEP